MLSDILILIGLLILNGLLSMSETALISCRRSHIQSRLEDIPHAKTLDRLLAHPGEFISALQIGITIISIFSGAYSGQRLAEPFGIWLNKIPYLEGYGSMLSFGIIVISMTYVTLLLSELVPKRIALSYPEHIALKVAGTVNALTRLSFFIVFMLNVSSKLILKILGFNDQKRNSLTEEELQYLFKQGLEEGTIGTFEHNTFKRVLGFGTIEASSIMTPRVKVVTLDINDSIEYNLNLILQEQHRYYPVIKKNPEHILGVVDGRELIKKHYNNELPNIEELMRTAPIVIEDNIGPEILQSFNEHAMKIALVVDEYGSFQGVITPFDILEAIIGSTTSVCDPEDQEIHVQENGSWLCSGLTPIHALEEVLKTKLIDPNYDNDFNTLAGFMLSHFNHVPKETESFEYAGYIFQVASMEHQRINTVIISII